MLRPFARPFQDPKSCASWIPQYDRWNYAQLFQRGGLTEARSGDAANSHQSLIAKGTINQSSTIQTAQERPEKSRERRPASRRVSDGKCSKIRGVVGHAAAEKLRRGIKVSWM